MALIKFAFAPESVSYSAQDTSSGVLSIKLDGGASRFRKNYVGSNSRVSVRWVFDPTEYRYMRAFYRFLTNKGAKPFRIDLITDGKFPEEHTAHFVPGSVRLQEQKGHSYVVTAELEASPTSD